ISNHHSVPSDLSPLNAFVIQTGMNKLVKYTSQSPTRAAGTYTNTRALREAILALGPEQNLKTRMRETSRNHFEAPVARQGQTMHVILDPEAGTVQAYYKT